MIAIKVNVSCAAKRFNFRTILPTNMNPNPRSLNNTSRLLHLAPWPALICLSFKDTLRECHEEDRQCLTYLPLVSPLYFVTFVLMAQFVLVNVVVAVLMKHLEESNKVTL